MTSPLLAAGTQVLVDHNFDWQAYDEAGRAGYGHYQCVCGHLAPDVVGIAGHVMERLAAAVGFDSEWAIAFSDAHPDGFLAGDLVVFTGEDAETEARAAYAEETTAGRVELRARVVSAWAAIA